MSAGRRSARPRSPRSQRPPAPRPPRHWRSWENYGESDADDLVKQDALFHEQLAALSGNSALLDPVRVPALMERGMSLIVVPQTTFEALDSFALMALPFFILAGTLMDRASIADRLVSFAHALVDWFRGGLGSAAVLSTMFFSTVSGSSSATAAAIGSVLIPKMEKAKYPRPFGATRWRREVWRTFKGALLSLCMPVVILGGLYLGVFTAIRCNADCPGTIDTPSLRERIAARADDLGGADRALAAFNDRQPIGRMGTAEEVADLVLFIASGRGFMTGSVVTADGGFSL